MDGASDGIERNESPEEAPETVEPSSPVEPPAAAAPDEPRADDASAPEAGAAEVKEKKRSAEAKAEKKRWRREPGLALSFRKGLPVDGRVEKVIRGGYEVRVGKARGFCPHSQMDLRHVDNPEEHVGQTHLFKVTQIRRGGEEVILSRRALLEDERSEEAKAVRATLVDGSIMQGHVARLTEFGVFVDLGAGVTGLVHVSEVSHAHVARLEDLLKPGEIVHVRILKLDETTGRISLSIRQAVDDPWKTVPQQYEPGKIYPGTVRRIAEFGAFVEMSPGVEALAPADGFPPSAAGWHEGLEVGQSRPFKVVSVEPVRRRMSVQPAADPAATSLAALDPGVKLKGRVQRVEKFGVFVWLAPGRVGLVPSIHTGTRKGTDLSRAFSIGKELEVEVVESDAGARRIRLAVPGAVQKAAPLRSETEAGPPRDRDRGAAPRPKPREEAPAQAPGFGTSLGDALREAFKKNEGES